MCKLSLNIVPNVYNSLQSSFLSLAWPWPGRSLPEGNQWEWWDPQQGALPGLGEVGHSPVGVGVGVLGHWTGAQCGWAFSPPATSNTLPIPPNAADTPTPLCFPWCHLYPCLPLSTYTPCQPPMHPWHPLHTLIAPMPPDTLHPRAPMPPDATYTPAGPWAPTLPASPLMPLHPLEAPMPPIPLLALEHLHILPAPNTPWHPYTP